MSYSGEAADQVVRLSLNGVEVAAKLSGSAAKQLAIMIYAILKDQKKTKGKIRLTNMLRSGKELKVFAVKDGDLQKFCEEAKKYGVLYCVLKDKNATDGITDIMVRAEDAAKVNRIFTRFGLATVDLLEQLSVEHSDDKVVGAVAIRDHRKDGGFPFTNFPQLHFICLGDSRKRCQVELFQMGDQGDLNGFQRLAAAGVVALVVPHGDMLGISTFQPLEQLVQGRHIFLVVLFHIPSTDHVHDHREVLLLRGRFVVEIGDKCF